ncbi:MAG: extracellular solute-binding protein [Polaromonas sp.]|jgi:putrescine transport system substrate-binding protein
MLNRQWSGIVFSVLTSLFLMSACGDKNAAAGPQPEAKILNIYNWPDYIAKDMIANFEKEFGIKVNYQSFENNEGLQSQLIAGSTGYDIVVPGAVFAKAQIAAGLYQPLDKTKLSNDANVDTALMAKLVQIDPGNVYLMPWAWSFTTVGINKAKVAQALGSTALPANAWDLVFDPAYTARLKSCGIVFLDSPTEILPPAMHYLGKNAYSNDLADHQAAGALLAKVRPHIRLFSSTMIDDLANGKACVALGWAGDINIAKGRALENKNGQEVEALLPATGGLIFFDNLAILKDAKHPNNAHTFINYFLRPEVSAALTNELGYPTVNKASLRLVDPGIATDKAVFPDQDDLKKMVLPDSFSNDARQSLSQVFTRFKKGG